MNGAVTALDLSENGQKLWDLDAGTGPLLSSSLSSENVGFLVFKPLHFCSFLVWRRKCAFEENDQFGMQLQRCDMLAGSVFTAM